MTFVEAMGVVSAVYGTPLPEVFDMAVSSIVTYATLAGRIVQMTNPLAAGGEASERTISAAELRRMLA